GGVLGSGYYDSYNLADLGVSGVIITNVQVVARVRRIAMNPSGTYPTNIGLGIRIGGISYFSNYGVSSNSYETIAKNYPTNPHTGSNWTVADINALQAFLGMSFINMFLWQGGLISGACTQVYVEVTYAAPPSVTTMPASNVGVISATLNGLLDNDGGLPANCGFQWGPDTNYGSVTPTEAKSTGQSFSRAISGLAPNTTYHFRAFATNANGTSYGSDGSFTTSAALPAAATIPATDIDLSKAMLHGILTYDGGQACECSFEWGLTADYGNGTPWQSGKHAGDAFAQLIASLEPDTVYHFRAQARNSAGLATGADTAFRTSKETVEVPGSLLDQSLSLLLEEET
ncbi:MAG: hypothetical protein Q8O55_12505, partial [Dehalococcoidales bacterium]|nr:hypothetical protein [Dehalococcoidales bacterium]